MRKTSVWRRLLGVENVIVEGVRMEDQDLVLEVRLYRRQQNRCGRCGQRAARYDPGEGRRRWRALDLGTTRAYLEAAAPRVHCRTHGVVVGQVPWADHDARFTRGFEEQTAWLAVECSKTAVAALMRISWRTIAGRLHSFCLSVVTDSLATPRPCIALELSGAVPDDAAWSQRLAAQFQAGLAGVNPDYRAALGEFPAAMAPIIELHAAARGRLRPTPVGSKSAESHAPTQPVEGDG